MAGNVWQWTADLYRADFHALAAQQVAQSDAVCSLNPTGPTDSFNPTSAVVGASSGTQFLVGLSVDAADYPNVPIEGNFPPPTSIGATIDPTFAIDPETPNASEFSITYSPGVVPEPSSAALLLIGAACLISRRRRFG
jgi:hypothetical protein